MDRTAIEKIEQLSLDANAIPQGYEGRIAVVGGEIVDLEQFDAGRRYYRASYTTHNIDDFVGYVGPSAAPIYVDADKMSAKHFADLGTIEQPGHGRHTATLKLRATPEWGAISAIPQWMSQQDAVLFLQDWSFAFAGGLDEEGKSMSLTETVAAIRRIKVDKTNNSESAVKNFGGQRSQLEDVQIATRMVDTLDFTLVPYVGLGLIDVRMQVQLALQDGRPPQVKFRLLQAVAWNDRIANSFVELLASRTTAPVRSGTLTI